MSWNLEELRNLIKEKYGDQQLEKASPHINSVDRKIKIASYHYHTCKMAFDNLFDDAEDEGIQALDLILSSEASKFYEAQLVAEANIIACAQSMHSVSDILPHVILHSLNINGKDDLTLRSVQKHLKDGELKNKIIKLLGQKEFCYLKDFVNTTKHFSLVFSPYKANLEDLKKQEHGLKFNDFSYQTPNGSKPRKHPEKWHGIFLEELKKLTVHYVNIGQEINSYLNKEVY